MTQGNGPVALPPPLDRIVFVLGSPRSGTTWLHAMLAAHPGVCTTDELKLFDHFTSRWEDAWRDLSTITREDTSKELGLRSLWSEDEFYAFLRDFVVSVYMRVADGQPDTVVFVDKTPAYAAHVMHIDRLFPEGRFIHVIRDGRDVAASLVRASAGWGRSWAPSSVVDAARTWRGFVESGLGGRGLEGRYLEVRYEEMLQDPARILRNCADFAGLEVPNGWIERTVEGHRIERMRRTGWAGSLSELPAGFLGEGRSGGWEDTMSPKERYEFHCAAGSLLCELGYAEGRWWATGPHHYYTLKARALLKDPGRLGRRLLRVLRRPGRSVKGSSADSTG